MKNISSHVLLFCFAIFFFSMGHGAATAANIAPLSLSQRLPSKPYLNVDYACGWDYPCAPRPQYGRYVRRYPHPVRGEVTINNYGTVNVYADGYRRHDRRPARDAGCGSYGCARETLREPEPYNCGRGPCDSGCGYYGCARGTLREPEPYNCGRGPCDSGCGVFCWFRRFKQGYCGHGCRYYRESARDYVEEAQPVTYSRAPYYDEVRPRVEEPIAPSRYELPMEGPRRLYKGPKYPR